MNIINTVAPVPVEQLKQYFTNKNTFYVIDYDASTLKGEKLLTYLSNLDIPCDISFGSIESSLNVLKVYLTFPMLLNCVSLELLMIAVIMNTKNIHKDPVLDEFCVENDEIIRSWIQKLDSLTLYNMYISADPVMKGIINGVEEVNINDTKGINFVSLLKHDLFFVTYQSIDTSSLKYFKSYFDDYMFKGKNMFSFWATEHNPLFLLTYGVSEGIVTGSDVVTAKHNTFIGDTHAAPI